jgi:crossover junction endodeoxyribonuclease RuvC
MIILGIDPGYERLGISIISKEDKKKEVFVYSECFKTSPKESHAQRLSLLGNKVQAVIDTYSPDVLAIEKLFFNSNQKTALLVAEARGVIVFTASQNNIRVAEYTPLEIKVAVTGYGRSDKKQIMSMIPRLISLNKTIHSDDEFDAIAVALTHGAIQR